MTNLNYEEALKALDNGQKVKLPEWVGYWFKKDEKIFVLDRNGDVLDSPYLDDYKNRTDWQITKGLRDFGGALLAVKSGKLISRLGWNGKNMFVFQRPEDELSIQMVVDTVKSLPKSVKDYYYYKSTFPFLESKQTVKFTSYLCLKSSDDSIVNGWTASQTDLLAEDWFIFE